MENILKNSNNGLAAEKAIFVLVHAAWQGPYAWETIKELLSKEGYQVKIVQLPGHGTDYTAVQSLHMQSYITHVKNAVSEIGENVILIGHSLAGIIISGVAEQIPELIEKLVYVAAYVPASGQSAYAISLLDKQSQLGAALLVSEDQSEFDIKKDAIINIFCQDGSDADQRLILENYRPEPAAPFSDPVILTDHNFGAVPKYYVETLLDHGIGNDLQKEMISAAGIKDVFELETGHTPSLSRPAELALIFTKIARQQH